MKDCPFTAMDLQSSVKILIVMICYTFRNTHINKMYSVFKFTSIISTTFTNLVLHKINRKNDLDD